MIQLTSRQSQNSAKLRQSSQFSKSDLDLRTPAASLALNCEGREQRFVLATANVFPTSSMHALIHKMRKMCAKAACFIFAYLFPNIRETLAGV